VTNIAKTPTAATVTPPTRRAPIVPSGNKKNTLVLVLPATWKYRIENVFLGIRESTFK
jgi:hypothetical protein